VYKKPDEDEEDDFLKREEIVVMIKMSSDLNNENRTMREK
jgi:hypothetical protein